jgi:nicotinamidase/pyrazinamidase
MRKPGPGDALLVVDVQNDFMPGGALGVQRGDEIIAPINRLLDRWSAAGLPVYLTRDWHPPDHCSFAAQGGPWPVHCVAGSEGARFAPALHVPAGVTVVSKATRRSEEAYSALHGTGLADDLRRATVERVFIAGLATDYCVRATAAEARAAGFQIVVLEDAVRAVNVRPGDGEQALDEMLAGGAQLTTTGAVLADLESRV